MCNDYQLSNDKTNKNTAKINNPQAHGKRNSSQIKNLIQDSPIVDKSSTEVIFIKNYYFY